MVFKTDTTERMRITSGGNVGIGTSSPSAKLVVSNGGALGYEIDPASTSGTVVSLFSYDRSASAWRTTKYSALEHIFESNGTTERMRITSGGNVLIGTTTDDGGAKLQVNGGIRSTSFLGVNYAASNTIGQGSFLTLANPSNSYQILQQLNASYNIDYWSYRGSWTNVSRIDGASGTYTALSDVNKKKDFEESKLGLNAILNLKPTLYRMKEESDDVEKHLGFIAQEVKEFIPQAYVEQDGFIGLNDRPIIAALVKAIQEQQAQIEELKELIKNK